MTRAATAPDLPPAPAAPSSPGRGYPPGLLDHHLRRVVASGIPPAVARARGYASVKTKATLAKLGFASYQQLVPGLLVPLHGTAGGVVGHQLRPDTPRTDAHGKVVKYESPRGARQVLDVPPAAQPYLGDPTVPLGITEGARKADAAVGRGLPCVSLNGVRAWRGTNRAGGKAALADWHDVALNGRLVYLLFDSDVTRKRAVAQALRELKGYLEHRGATVQVVYLPPPAPEEVDEAGNPREKTGLDDFLAPRESLDELFALAEDEVRPDPEPDDPREPDRGDPFASLPAAPPGRPSSGGCRRRGQGRGRGRGRRGRPPPDPGLPHRPGAGAHQGRDRDPPRPPAGLRRRGRPGGRPAALGGNASIRVVEGREERANVWLSLVGPPGSGKSPAQDLAFAALRAHDAQARETYEEQLRAWRATPVQDRREADRPADGSLLRRDTTVEAIARRLYATGGDLALDVDELRTLIAGLGQYKAPRTGGRGGHDGPDLAKFLELWHGGPWNYTRVGSGGGGENAVDFLIARPTLVLCGSVQTEYQSLLGAEGDGLRPRWLPHLATYAAPPPARSEAELATAAGAATQAREAWATRLRALVARRGTARDWTLDPGAQRRFYELERTWKQQARAAEESASTSAALLKADRQLLRLVLIVAELHDPGGTQGRRLSAAHLDAVAPLLTFCLDCWRALPTAAALALTYQAAVLNDAVDTLAAWLEHHGGAATPRELKLAHVAGVRTTGDLNLLLKRYGATYPGTIKPTEPGPQGGRPGRLVLAPRRARVGECVEFVANGYKPPTPPPCDDPAEAGAGACTPGSGAAEEAEGSGEGVATNPPEVATNPPEVATNPPPGGGRGRGVGGRPCLARSARPPRLPRSRTAPLGETPWPVLRSFVSSGDGAPGSRSTAATW